VGVPCVQGIVVALTVDDEFGLNSTGEEEGGDANYSTNVGDQRCPSRLHTGMVPVINAQN